jgi:hypothetical protein
VVNQKGSNKGRFTFTAGDAGEHRICFWASHQSNSGWFSSHANGVRLHLDLAIGETTKIESRDKEKLADIEQRVRDLSGRLQDIRREQVFQRVSSEIMRTVFARDEENWQSHLASVEKALGLVGMLLRYILFVPSTYGKGRPICGADVETGT